MSYKAAIITVSDKGFIGERVDTSGPALAEMLKKEEYHVTHMQIVPDEVKRIREALIYCADELHLDLVLTTGGTGLSPRDVTPEATLSVIEREIRAIPTAMLIESLKITPKACLSRMVAGTRKETLIINLPGSKKGATENLSAVIMALEHGIETIHSKGSANCGDDGI